MNVVSAALNKHLHLWWTAETSAAIEAEYGEKVLEVARRIYDVAVHHPVASWEPYDAAIESVMVSLAAKYPFLDPTTIRRLGNCFAYANK